MPWLPMWRARTILRAGCNSSWDSTGTGGQGHRKALHKLVSKQVEARKGLAKARADRANFEAAWNGYMNHLAQLLETQMQERAEALQAYDQSEDAWKAQLEATTSELGRHASRPESAEAEEPIDVDAEMELQEQAVSDAAEEEAKRSVKAQKQREEADNKARRPSLPL